jgi:flagellar biosynthesis chaperone FliJ
MGEIQKERASFRLQPCQGDLEIRKKEEKLEEIDKRIKSVQETIRELERKRQELMAEARRKSGFESPFS